MSSKESKNEDLELVVVSPKKAEGKHVEKPAAKKEEQETLSEGSLIAIGNLLYAASKGDGAAVLKILARGEVDVDVGDYDRRTALHIAASEGHLELVKTLIEKGANPNPKDRWGSTPLDDSIRHEFENVAVYLREHGGTNGDTSKFEQELINAAAKGDLAKVQSLVKSGTSVNAADYDKRSALHVAVAERKLDVVRYLIEQGADINVEDRFGYTPINEAHRSAVRLGEDEIVKLLKAVQNNGEHGHHKWYSRFMDPFVFLIASFQIVIIILFSIFTAYDHEADGSRAAELGMATVTQYYAFYMDVHVMIFIGFGFLMTFLRKYGYSSVGLNFLLGTIAIEWYILTGAFFEYVVQQDSGKSMINIERLIRADFSAGAVLITFGALLGKTSPAQMCMIAIFEVIVYSINEAVGIQIGAADIGGSFTIHTFGAYFGLAASVVLTPTKARGNKDNSAVYRSDLFSMIGTIFLWIYWPSFNAAFGVGQTQHRAVVNTVLSITASCVTAFLASHVIRGEKIFNMVDIQNATLAGGVAIGASADMILHPAVAIGVGTFTGLISVTGFSKLQSLIETKLTIHDTCGVHNLHGMPGIIGALVSVIAAGWANTSFYQQGQLEQVFPERATHSAGHQAGIQFAYLCITLGFAIVGGVIGGFIAKLYTPAKKFFVDDEYWEVPALELPYYFDKRGEVARDRQHEEGAGEKHQGINLPNQAMESRLAIVENKIAQLLQRTAKSASGSESSEVMQTLSEAVMMLAKAQGATTPHKERKKDKEKKKE